MTPEIRERQQIDDKLVQADWQMEDMAALNLGASRGIAVRQHPAGPSPADSVLLVDRIAVGVIEAFKGCA